MPLTMNPGSPRAQATSRRGSPDPTVRSTSPRASRCTGRPARRPTMNSAAGASRPATAMTFRKASVSSPRVAAGRGPGRRKDRKAATPAAERRRTVSRISEAHLAKGASGQDLVCQPLQPPSRPDLSDPSTDRLWNWAKAPFHLTQEKVTLALGTALLLPFLPLSLAPRNQVLFQHRGVLQVDDIWDCNSGSDSPEHMSEPFADGLAEVGLIRGDKGREISGQAGDLLDLFTGLNPEQRGHPVAGKLGTIQVQAVLIQQQIAEARQVAPQAGGHLLEQARKVERGQPAPLAVVEHQCQHGRKTVSWPQPLFTDDLLQEEANVGQHPDRHEGVRGRLELQKHIEVHVAPGLAAPTHPPDEVAPAFSMVGADEAAADAFQGRKVEPDCPVFPQEAAQQVLNRLRMGEESLVPGIVPGGHDLARSFSRSHRHIRRKNGRQSCNP